MSRYVLIDQPIATGLTLHLFPSPPRSSDPLVHLIIIIIIISSINICSSRTTLPSSCVPHLGELENSGLQTCWRSRLMTLFIVVVILVNPVHSFLFITDDVLVLSLDLGYSSPPNHPSEEQKGQSGRVEQLLFEKSILFVLLLLVIHILQSNCLSFGFGV